MSLAPQFASEHTVIVDHLGAILVYLRFNLGPGGGGGRSDPPDP
jgi:hypothetical protein